MSKFSTRKARDTDFLTIEEFAKFFGRRVTPIYITRLQLERLLNGDVMVHEGDFGDYVGFMIEPEEETQ